MLEPLCVADRNLALTILFPSTFPQPALLRGFLFSVQFALRGAEEGVARKGELGPPRSETWIPCMFYTVPLLPYWYTIWCTIPGGVPFGIQYGVHHMVYDSVCNMVCLISHDKKCICIRVQKGPYVDHRCRKTR